MYRITRFFLVLDVLLFVYCAVMAAILFPWAWVVVAIGALAFLSRKRHSLHAFGTARWAEIYDLHGMFDGNGLIIGKIHNTMNRLGAIKALFDSSLSALMACVLICSKPGKPIDRLVTLNKPPHIAVFAPTGAGKGVSFVVPFLLTCTDSCVVVDLKAGELARLTAEARRQMGHRVFILDPFHCVTETPDTLNPLEFIDKDSSFAIDDCREVAAAMVDRKDEKGDGVHFLDNAESAIAGICALLTQYAEGKDKSLQALCDICSNAQDWQMAIQRMCGSDAWQGMLARMGGNLAHLKERELASSMSTTARFLRFLSTPAIAESTWTSSFNPSDLRTKRTTIYLILPPERAAALSQLLRLWIGTLLRAVVKGGLQEKNKVHFVIDEANLVGKMDQISDALTIGRGFGLKLQLYYQDCGQLKKCWPDGADQTLLANVAQVFFAVNDQPTAEYVSSRLGEETIVVASGGTSTSSSRQRSSGQGQGSSSYSTSTSANNNWAQQARRLLKPEEVTALSERIAITFTPGVPPIWTTLVRYYESEFSKRPGRFWFAAKGLAVAACLLLLIGLLAFGATLIVMQQIR